MALIRNLAWGGNTLGQLGDGTTTNKFTPVEIPGLGRLVSIAAGLFHTLAVKDDGTVWAWGDNRFGQLGDGTTSNKSTPVQVTGLTSVVAVAAGPFHSLAVKSDGTVWAWGLNYSGELGDGTTTNRLTPVQVPGLTDVIAVAGGGGAYVLITATVTPACYEHSLALKKDGTVWAWGSNRYGELGDGTTTAKSTPVQVVGLGGSGYLTGVVAIAAGGHHCLALKSDGTVWAWGKGTEGQLGNNAASNSATPVQVVGPGGVDYLTGIIAIAAGSYYATSVGALVGYSLALKSDGTVWSWGANYYGELGDGTTSSKSTPVNVSGLTDVTAIVGARGGYLGDNTPRGGFSLAVKSDGTIWSWGLNNSGQLGDGTTSNRLTPVKVSGKGNVTTVAAGGHHSVAANTTKALMFADFDGYPINEKNLGTFIAGSYIGPAGVDLYNGTGVSVNNVTVSPQNLPPDDTVEISSTSNPFVPKSPLYISGTFTPEQKIGTIYIRVTAPILTSTGQPNQGLKEFKLKATAIST